jgi:O-antigen/teichoic acid export membrane protein
MGGCVCFGLSFFFNRWFGIKPEYQAEIRHALCLLALWLAVRSIITPYPLAINSLQWIAVTNLCSLFSAILRLVFSLALVLLGWGVLGLVVAYMIADGVSLNIQRLIFVREFRSVPEASTRPVTDFALFKEVFSFGIFVFLGQLYWQIGFQSDMVVTGILFGAWASSVYYSTFLPASTMYQTVMRFFDNFIPGLNQIWGSHNPTAVRHVALRMYRYGAAMMWPVPALICAYGERIVTAWVGRAQFAGFSMLLAMATYCLYLIIGRSSDIVLNVAGRIRAVYLLAVCDGFVNLGLSFYLGRKLGIPGVMWATVIATFPRAIYTNLLALRVLGLKTGEFLRSFGIGFLLRGLLCWALIAAVASRHLVWPSKYGVFAEVAALYFAWLLVVAAAVLDRDDRSRLFRTFAGKFA